ncbi:stage III sporulation protein AF [Bacillus sp. JCM 19047]|uniref:Stage III sporulation protein AF n=1 Tax=Shouchella miscanthi TaxID=2598861 RepID=A0ABU6NH49_9BACI|nr:stage III sporulation protein AF [Shouchella miscanthi]MED4127518.1 stage III sporulation protein AF [Shouchella miscanthi]GAF22660.1 stage III sporulation protein AF [Bacillus sp. JCM 19047]
MTYINEWITSIVIIILLAVVLEMALPNTKLKNYVKITMSLLLLLFLLQPVLNIFYEDPDEWLNEVIQQTTSEEINVEEEINSQKKDIERFFDAYTSEQVAVQLKDQANGDLKKEEDLMVTDLSIIQDNNGEFTQIEVVVVPYQEEERTSTSRTDEVEPVSIMIGETESKEDAVSYEEQDVISMLADIWGVPSSVITLKEEGGWVN